MLTPPRQIISERLPYESDFPFSGTALLAPHETQTYTLTLAPTTAGTYQLTGWTTQPIAGGSGGTSQTVTITVTP